MRLVAAITVSVILLPFILWLYLTLSPTADAEDVWLSLVQTAPFGDSIATGVVAVWGEAQSGVEGIVEWLVSQKLSFPQYFSMELGKLIFTSVLMLIISSLIGQKLFSDTGGGMFDQAANVVFQVLLTFSASLATDAILDTYLTNLTYAEGMKHDVAAWGYAVILLVMGVSMLIVCRVTIIDAILLVAIGCLKLTTSYGFFLWLLLIEIQNGSRWMLAVGIVLMLIAIWLLQSLERIFLPK